MTDRKNKEEKDLNNRNNTVCDDGQNQNNIEKKTKFASEANINIIQDDIEFPAKTSKDSASQRQNEKKMKILYWTTVFASLATVASFIITSIALSNSNKSNEIAQNANYLAIEANTISSKAVEEAKKANEASENALNISKFNYNGNPTLVAEVVDNDLSFSSAVQKKDKMKIINIRINIRNVGESTALNVKVAGILHSRYGDNQFDNFTNRDAAIEAMKNGPWHDYKSDNRTMPFDTPLKQESFLLPTRDVSSIDPKSEFIKDYVMMSGLDFVYNNSINGVDINYIDLYLYCENNIGQMFITKQKIVHFTDNLIKTGIDKTVRIPSLFSDEITVKPYSKEEYKKLYDFLKKREEVEKVIQNYIE